MIKDALYIRRLEALVLQAAPWVDTRMRKHDRGAKSARAAHWIEKHRIQADVCEAWLIEAAALGLDTTSEQNPPW